MLAAVPALIGLAVGIVTVRLYPYPVRAAGWIAAAGRGMVPALGLRRAERTGDGAPAAHRAAADRRDRHLLVRHLVTIDRGQLPSRGRTSAPTGHHARHRLWPLDFPPRGPGVAAAARMPDDSAVIGGRGGARVQMNALDMPRVRRASLPEPRSTRDFRA